MSEENEEGDDKVEQNKYLTFLIGKEGYGISILNVVEIIRYIKITDIPDSVPFIKGIINLRDKIIPVMSVRLRFKLEEKEFDDRTCIVVVNIQGMSIGLLIDSVSEVLEIEEDRIESMPSFNNCDQKNFISGIGKVNDQVKILLDLDKLISGIGLDKIKVAA